MYVCTIIEQIKFILSFYICSIVYINYVDYILSVCIFVFYCVLASEFSVCIMYVLVSIISSLYFGSHKTVTLVFILSRHKL